MESQTRIRIKLGKKIKTLRKGKGLYLDELAKQAELSKSTLNYIERGVCDPRLSSLIGIARALDIELGILLNYI